MSKLNWSRTPVRQATGRKTHFRPFFRITTPSDTANWDAHWHRNENGNMRRNLFGVWATIFRDRKDQQRFRWARGGEMGELFDSEERAMRDAFYSALDRIKARE